jgi:small conductance mechanosensitive channel
MEAEIQQVQEIYNLIAEFLVTYSFQIVGALIILAIGVLMSRKLGRVIEALLLRQKIDVTLSRFTASAVRIVVLAMVAIMALGKVGISVTPFIATIGALGLGAGLAMQGMLSNYAAGVTIIVTRPFVVGDTISILGVTGLVREVHLGYTTLTNEDEVRITIPNKHILGEIIHNSFTDSIVEMTVSISYKSDPVAASGLVADAIGKVNGVSKRRAPQVGIHDFGDDGYLLGVRYWAATVELFTVRYAVNAKINQVLLANGIELTYPQREVRIVKDEAAS